MYNGSFIFQVLIMFTFDAIAPYVFPQKLQLYQGVRELSF